MPACHPDSSAFPRDPVGAIVPWMLRAGVALCFIGHGAFGIVTKQAWVPYFAVAGIDEPTAWRLMPWVGTMDVAIGLLALLWPCRALFAWAAIWATWTALLRPFAEQGWPEFFERAGNYGVPIAILVVVGLRAPWFGRLPESWTQLDSSMARHRLAWTLRLTTVALIAGHAGCALVLRSAGLAQNYAVFWPNHVTDVMLLVGGFECVLALVALLRPTPAFLVGVGAWKLATECLFLLSAAAAPMFEVIERGGSYVAPLTLAILLWKRAPRSLPTPLIPTLAV